MSESREQFDPYHQWLGIPPEEQPPHHYRLLGIKVLEDNVDVIEHAADRQMTHVRTFQTGPRAALSQKLLNELAAAKRCLLTPERKAAYDEQLRAAIAAASEDGEALGFVVAGGRPHVGAGGGRPRRRRRRRPSLGVVIVCLVGVGVVAAGVWYVAGHLPASSSTRLVLAWPREDREGARLEIDGRAVDLATEPVASGAAELEFELGPGDHTLRITKDGFQPLTKSFSLTAGSRQLVSALLTSRPLASLILDWPESERAGAILEIDGQPRDVKKDAASVNTTEVRFQVDPGEHTVRVVRDGVELYNKSFAIGEGKSLRLIARPSAKPTVGQLVLIWPVSERKGAVLEIDGQRRNATDAASTDGPDRLAFPMEPGEHSYRVIYDGAVTYERAFTLAAGERREYTLAAPGSTRRARLVLVWPEDQRRGATLTIDGLRQDVSRKLGTSPSQQLEFDLDPGQHTLHAVREGYEDFQHTLDDLQGEVTVPVTWKALPRARPSAEQLEQARASFQQAYLEYDEYKRWQAETDADTKRREFKTLADRLQVEAQRFAQDSAEQLAAFEESLELALNTSHFVTAQAIIDAMRQTGTYRDQELADAGDVVWNAALRSTAIDPLVSYLILMKNAGRVPSDAEQTALRDRFVQAADDRASPWSLTGLVEALQAAGLMTEDVANEARVAVLLKASRDKVTSAEAGFSLTERLLDFVPAVLRRDDDECVVTATEMVEAANNCRRKAISVDKQAARYYQARAAGLNDELKEMRELINLRARVSEAEQAAQAGTIADSQRRVLGIWLLGKGRVEDALEHLRQCDDPALKVLAAPLTASAQDLAARADAVIEESLKKKYSTVQQSALGVLADHLRQQALGMDDGTLPGPERTQLQARVTAFASANDPHAQTLARTFPKGRWRYLLELAPAMTFRDAAAATGRDKWSVLDDGTLICAGQGLAKLELPVTVTGGFAIRCLCTPGSRQNASVNLPVGADSVLFQLGAVGGQYNGLAMVDGRRIDDPQNPGFIPKSEFSVQPNTPVLVELHVDLLARAEQSDEQLKLSQGQDWASVTVLLNRRPVRGISGITSRFAVDNIHQLSQNVVGLSTNGGATFSEIQLMRK
ncbi:MAG: hypothetical protein FJ276_20860 [Planctomycetes bacterium]|nr:hypothetical protein [Planctomycetota bacterium]